MLHAPTLIPGFDELGVQNAELTQSRCVVDIDTWLPAEILTRVAQREVPVSSSRPLSKPLAQKSFLDDFPEGDFTVHDVDFSTCPSANEIILVDAADLEQEHEAATILYLKSLDSCSSDSSTEAPTTEPSSRPTSENLPRFDSHDSIHLPAMEFDKAMDSTRAQLSLASARLVDLPRCMSWAHTPRSSRNELAALADDLAVCKRQLAGLEVKDVVLLRDCTQLLDKLVFLCSESLEAACTRNIAGAMDLYEETNEVMERVSVILDIHARG